jgi:LysR family transcriptional regulator, glycine cleavage system transcriptional activator
MQRIPPLHCLQAFEALARIRNGIQAAHELSITPSALSHRIKQLETQLGTALFSDASYALTTAGSNCLVLVRQSLSTLQRLPQAAESTSVKHLKIAVTPTFARQLLMPKLPLFRLAYPDIDLVIQVAVPLVAARAHEVDLEIRFGNGDFKDVQSTCLLHDTVTPVCSPMFLQNTGSLHNFTQLHEIKNTTLIRSSLEPWGTWFNRFGITLAEPTDGAQFNDVGMVLEAAAAGYGIALMRRKLGAAWIESGRLVQISSESVEPPFQHYICWQPGTLDRWECSAFFDWITQIIN